MSNYGLRILSVRCAVRRLEQCTVVEVWEWANRWCDCSRQTVTHYLSRMAASGEIKRIGVNQYSNTQRERETAHETAL